MNCRYNVFPVVVSMILALRVCGLAPEPEGTPAQAFAAHTMPYQIQAATDTEKCMDAQGGRSLDGNNIILRPCDELNPNQQFLLPARSGQIRLALEPSKCLTASAFGYVEIWDCGARRGNQDFVVNVSAQKGRISFGRNNNQCMSIAPRWILTSKIKTSRCRSRVANDEFVFSMLPTPVPNLTLVGALQIQNSLMEVVAVQGEYAYVSGATGLSIVDVREKENPKLLSAYTQWVYGSASVSVDGDYAFATGSCADSIVKVLDVSNKSNPRLVGSIDGLADLVSCPQSVVADGNYVYVTNAQEGVGPMSVLDVSNKSAPRVVGTLPGPVSKFMMRGLAVDMNYAFVTLAMSNAFLVVNVQDKENPSEIARLTANEALSGPALQTPGGVAVSGNYAFIANAGSNSLSIVDVSTKENPILMGTVRDDIALNLPQGVAIRGSYAFVASARGGSSLKGCVCVVDVSDKAHPFVVSIMEDTRYLRGPDSVTISGKYGFVTSYDSGAMSVLELASGSSPEPTTPSPTSAPPPYQIKAATDIEKCMDVQGGRTHNGNNLILWTCDKFNPNQRFLLPEGKGQIKWAAEPSKCLIATASGYIEIWDCGARHGNQDFIVENTEARKGRITFGRNNNQCMSIAPRVFLSNKISVSRCGSRRANDEFVFSSLATQMPTAAP